MIEPRIVRRYASALFGAALKAGAVDRVESDLGLVSYVIETSPQFAATMRSPLFPAREKRDILRDIFADKVHQITLSYLYLLVDKRRQEAIGQTEREYILLANEHRGIITAQVTTAVKLAEDQEAALQNKLGAITGKTVQLDMKVDPRIIGGVVVKIGDTVTDGSIRGQLANLREQLLS